MNQVHLIQLIRRLFLSSGWSDIVRASDRGAPMPQLSFEFYPPKTEEQRLQLDRTVGRLKK